jgi:hypothetical protein
LAPADLVRVSTLCFLAAMAGIILHHILTGRISMAGLLYERAPDGRLVYSPARVQLLLTTLTGVAIYLSRFDPNSGKLPTLDPAAVTGVGGSQTFYLISKAWAAYQARKP